MKKKKYSMGKEIKLESVNDALLDNNKELNQAYYEGYSNPYTLGLDFAAPFLGQIADIGAEAYKAKKMAAMGMESNGQELVEAEQGEVLEQGDMSALIQGNKHEQGGTDVMVDENTNIFSDRIKYKGQSLAKRKQKRDREVEKIAKLIEQFPDDPLLKNSLEKTAKDNEMLDQKDLMYQKLMRETSNVKDNGKFAWGKEKKPIASFNAFDMSNWGTDNELKFKGLNSLDPLKVSGFAKEFEKTLLKPAPPKYKPFSIDGENRTIGTDEPLTGNTFEPLSGSPVDLESKNEIWDFNNLPKNDTKVEIKTNPTLENLLADYFKNKNKPTTGDMMALTGQAMNTIGPLLNTMQNRAGDTKNINPFENYNNEALAEINKLFQANNMAFSDNQRSIDSSIKSQKNDNRNSARSINTERILNQAAEANRREANSKNITNKFTQNAGISARKATMLSDKSLRNGIGVSMQDQNNRKDRDNYFTQKGEDLNQMGLGLQYLGKSVNHYKKQDEMMEFVNTLSKYGYKMQK